MARRHNCIQERFCRHASMSVCLGCYPVPQYHSHCRCCIICLTKSLMVRDCHAWHCAVCTHHGKSAAHCMCRVCIIACFDAQLALSALQYGPEALTAWNALPGQACLALLPSTACIVQTDTTVLSLVHCTRTFVTLMYWQLNFEL